MKLPPPFPSFIKVEGKEVLNFKSKSEFKIFYAKIEKSKTSIGLIPEGFISLGSKLQGFKTSKYQSRANDIETVDTLEYLHDLQTSLINDEVEAEVFNENMQIVIQDTFYHLTRIGYFKVPLNSLEQYLILYQDFEDKILYDPTFIALPNERLLGGGEYLIDNGITRNPVYLQMFDYDLGTTSGSYNSPCSTTFPSSLNYEEFSVGSDFNRKEAINFDDKRFVFETFNTNFLGIIHGIGIRGKLQRERKFAWFNYWGESFADEIIVGVNNMDLKTSYVFPTPQQFNTLSQPQFTGFFNLQIGNHVIEALGVNVNINAPFGLGQNISNTDAANFINGNFNSLVNNTFNDLFTPFVNSLIANFDPSFPVRYENHAKRIYSLMEQNKFRISLNTGLKNQGYSKKNTWRFDWNIGAEILPGPYTTDPTYTYDMKAGNFFGRARLGCNWYGIKIVRL